MFNRSLNKSTTGSFSKGRRDTKTKSSFRENAVSKNRAEPSRTTRKPPAEETPAPRQVIHQSAIIQRCLLTLSINSTLTSSIITLVVGREQRLFAAHEDVLCISPFFAAACRNQFMSPDSKRILLPDEEPEIFSSVLEYLYKGDYYPKLVHNKRRNSWELETEGQSGSMESTVYHHGVDGEILKDTVIYCTAEKYGLDELKRVALRKQGLRKSRPYFRSSAQANRT